MMIHKAEMGGGVEHGMGGGDTPPSEKGMDVMGRGTCTVRALLLLLMPPVAA